MSPHGDTHTHDSHVLHGARFYDAVVWVLARGRERHLRRAVLGHADLTSGQSVLDVGCGTGTLAILAADAVGAGGEVHGADPSPEMIARARRKAAKEGARVTFETASVEALPFPADRFDVVLSMLMLHHVPAAVRDRGGAEVVRVLRPGGRFLAVDLGGGASDARHGGPLGRIRDRLPGARHSHRDYSFDAVVAGFVGAGLTIADQGSIDTPRIVGLPDIRFVLATKPA